MGAYVNPITWDHLVAKWRERQVPHDGRATFIFEVRNAIVGMGGDYVVAGFNRPFDLYRYIELTWTRGDILNIWAHGKMLMRHDDLLRLFAGPLEFDAATRGIE